MGRLLENMFKPWERAVHQEILPDRQSLLLWCAAQAMEIVRLKDRLAEAEEGRRDTHAKLAAARADVHRLEDRITSLEQGLDQSHSCAPPQHNTTVAHASAGLHGCL